MLTLYHMCADYRTQRDSMGQNFLFFQYSFYCCTHIMKTLKCHKKKSKLFFESEMLASGNLNRCKIIKPGLYFMQPRGIYLNEPGAFEQ